MLMLGTFRYSNENVRCSLDLARAVEKMPFDMPGENMGNPNAPDSPMYVERTPKPFACVTDYLLYPKQVY